MNQKGIALIMAVGVLALLAIIATSFALNMRLEYHAATNYYNGVKARYFAEAALQRAIAELRLHVKSSAFDDLISAGEVWSTTGYNNTTINANIVTATGISRTLVSASDKGVVDEQRKVNINNANATLLANLLNEFSISSPSGSDIANERTNNGSYKDIHELITRAGLSKADFSTIKKYITLNSHVDNNTGLAPINVNTADIKVLNSVIGGISDGITTINNPTSIVTEIISARSMSSINSWSEFDTIIDNFQAGGSITPQEATVIKNNCNPNRTKPSTYTTEFCFNSGGYYNVVVEGKVLDPLTGLVPLATRTLNATVRIYKIYCETKIKDGSNNPTQFALGTPVRVTWLDSCPIRSTDLFGAYNLATPQTVAGSIKLGFWDDFSDSTYTGNVWKQVEAAAANIVSEKWYFFNWAKYQLGQDAGNYTGYKDWINYSISLYERDNAYNPSGSMKDVGWIFIKGMAVGDPAILHARSGNLEWGPLGDPKYAYQNPSGSSGDVIFLTDTVAQADPYYFTPSTDRYPYSPQIRIFRYRNNSNTENYDNSAYRSLFAYDTVDRSKRYNILVNSTNLTITVYPPTGSSGSFSVYDINSGSGVFGLYAQANNIWWDDMRLISQDGNFTSQAINSTIIPVLADSTSFAWGTIATTVTIPSTASAASETATIQTKSSSDATWLSPSGTLAEHIASTKPASGAASIQYKTFLVTGDSEINETPVLEDVTITYLPKVAIKSYLLSN